MEEIIYKILYLVNNQYLTRYYASIHKGELFVQTSKKGRTWKRYCDIIVAWKTLKKSLKEIGREEDLVNFKIQILETVFVKNIEFEELDAEIEKRNLLYQERKLKMEKSNLEYRIRQLSESKTFSEKALKELKLQLEKLNK